MPRQVPGSGAEIIPIFNSISGVREVYVTNGGRGYDPNNPPRLRVENCGTPIRDAILRPVIDGANGAIAAVEVLDPGEGYSPLRLRIDGPQNATKADGKIFLKSNGEIDYIQITKPGDDYFEYSTSQITATIVGGGGSGAELRPVSGSVTGLSIESFGKNYTENDVTLVISGGGGLNATGVASVTKFGAVTEIQLTNPGEFFQTPPIVQLYGGGGSGASAIATTNLGQINSIQLLSEGSGYVNPPQVIFARNSNLIKTARNRQSLEAVIYDVVGVIADVSEEDNEIFVETTNKFAGSGIILLGKEIIRYTGKTAISFTGCDRGTNFRFDQRVTLDSLQDSTNGISNYQFQVTDKIKRVVENQNNRVPIVYDWDNVSNSLYLTFEIDALAFIDGGRSGEKAKIISFIGGAAGASSTGQGPHVIEDLTGSDIIAFTIGGLTTIQNRVFRDVIPAYLDGEGVQQYGDGIPDLYNADTEFESQISLDGGIASSTYGIEETLGGTNTTLFQIGDQLYDGSLSPLVATVIGAGQLGDGDVHESVAEITIVYNNSISFLVNPAPEVVEGLTSGIMATTVSRKVGIKTGEFILTVKNIQISDPVFKFIKGEILRGNTSASLATIVAIEYITYARNEDE